MKSRFAAIFGIIVLASLAFWFLSEHEFTEPPGAARPPAAGPSTPRPPAALPTSGGVASSAGPAPAATDPTKRQLNNPLAPSSYPDVVPPIVKEPDPQSMIDMNKVTRMLRDYRSLTGANPVGSNAEIMRVIMGDNPKRAKLGPPEGLSLNGDGELMDRWGTPYFFHQLSADLMEIRSAGPDRKMWTGDDVVGR
jgi:hypothetical protein